MNLNNQTYIVGVRLNNGKDELTSKVYHFLAPAPLAVGDTVVCDTCNGFIVGMVAEIDIKESSVRPFKEVVDRVNVEPRPDVRNSNRKWTSGSPSSRRRPFMRCWPKRIRFLRKCWTSTAH